MRRDDHVVELPERARRLQRLGRGHVETDVDAPRLRVRKQRRVVRGARAFLARERTPRHGRIRFDVVAIDASRTPPSIRLIRDAFDAG